MSCHRTGRPLAALLLACLLPLGARAAAPATPAVLAVEAPITAVTVYPGSATVERTVPLAAGLRTLEIGGLASTLDPHSLQVSAPPGARIGQIVVREVARQDGATPREKELNRRLREVRDQIEAIEAEARAAGVANAWLDRLSGEWAGERAPGDPRWLAGVAETVEAAALRARQRALRAEQRKRPLAEEAERLEFELAQLRSGARDSRVVRVTVAAERAGDLRLSYQIPRAGWQPAYRAALDTRRGALELERLALISQKTGEDWSEVRLRLSTGQPHALRLPPEPVTRAVTWHPPVAPQAREELRPLARAAAAPPAPAAAPAAKSLAEAADDYVAPVIENRGAYASEFEVPARVHLPADGREVMVSLGRQALAVTQRLRVAPALDRAAVLTAEGERPAGVWLPGMVQLFRDGTYVGSTRWQPDAGAAPGRLVLGFGHDDQLGVRVERDVRHSGSAGFTGQRVEERRAEIFVLHNRHAQPVEVQVLEASPVAQSEEIRVEREFTPPPDEDGWAGRRGVVAWTRTLAPDETWRVRAAYTITHPREGRVSGLP